MNVDGLGSGDKLDALRGYVQWFHIVFLVETRTRNVSELARRLPGYDLHQVPARYQGRKGSGVVVCVQQAVANYVTLKASHHEPDCIWLEVHGTVLGKSGSFFIGGVYIPPELPAASHSGHQRGSEEVLEEFGIVHEEVRQFRELGAEVMVLGDFNAHLPIHSNYVEMQGDATRVCPALVSGRHRIEQVAENEAGNWLEAVAGLNDCVLTTGCGKGDVGQSTCCVYTSEPRDSRPDHLFMTPTLYQATTRIGVQHEVAISDHRPLSLALMCMLTGVDLRTPAEQQTQSGEVRKMLRWRDELQPA